MSWLGQFKGVPALDDIGFHRPLRWYHITVFEDVLGQVDFKLTDIDDIGQRPVDALPACGNPYTPWYNTEEHLDEEHVHLYAQNAQHALMRARALYEQEFGHVEDNRKEES